MRGEALKGHLDLLILAAIEPEPQHGYSIIEALRAKSNGVFDLPEGTIYPALHRLERAGLLGSRWSVHEGRRRRVYRLTAAGKAALHHETEQWSTFALAVAAVVGITA
jgi:PadR family transcriptional regulator, regulatory protein PadR